MINRQLSKQGIRWPVSPDHTAGVSVHPSKSSIFWSYPLTNYQFQMIAGSISFFPMIHMKYVVFMLLWPRTVKILISDWPWTRNSASFFNNTGGEDLFLPWSRVGHALCPTFMLWLLKIWQVSLLLTILFHWMYKMNYSCYQESSVLHGWFVYWVFGRKMRRLSKFDNPISDGIVSVFHLA